MPSIPPPPENLDNIRRIGVVADTHIPDRVRSLHPDLITGLKAAEVDLIIHAGDICAPAVLTELSQVAPVVAVRGNRDWVFAGTLPWVQIITIWELRIVIQHGMGSFWLYWFDKMKYATVGYQFPRYKHLLQKIAPGNDVYIFGHTHRSENRREGEVLYFNPGAASITPLFKVNPSFGVLYLDGSRGVTGEVISMRPLQVERGNWVIPK